MQTKRRWVTQAADGRAGTGIQTVGQSLCYAAFMSCSQGTKPAAHQEDICLPESVQIWGWNSTGKHLADDSGSRGPILWEFIHGHRVRWRKQKMGSQADGYTETAITEGELYHLHLNFTYPIREAPLLPALSRWENTCNLTEHTEWVVNPVPTCPRLGWMETSAYQGH